MLTKKHFEAIAEIIKDSTTGNNELVSKPYLVTRLADYLAKQNQNFDRIRFYYASEIPEIIGHDEPYK